MAVCLCGFRTLHNLGDDKCSREWVSVEEEPRQDYAGIYELKGFRIASIVLEYQLFYHYHSDDKKWSRLKDPAILNSWLERRGVKKKDSISFYLSTKTNRCRVTKRKEFAGILLYPNQHVMFESSGRTQFNSGELRQIADFMDSMKSRRKRKKEK